MLSRLRELLTRVGFLGSAELDAAAYKVADERRNGRFGNIERATDDVLVQALRERCPGFSNRRYRSALAHALYLTR